MVIQSGSKALPPSPSSSRRVRGKEEHEQRSVQHTTCRGGVPPCPAIPGSLNLPFAFGTQDVATSLGGASAGQLTRITDHTCRVRPPRTGAFPRPVKAFAYPDVLQEGAILLSTCGTVSTPEKCQLQTVHGWPSSITPPSDEEVPASLCSVALLRVTHCLPILNPMRYCRLRSQSTRIINSHQSRVFVVIVLACIKGQDICTKLDNRRSRNTQHPVRIIKSQIYKADNITMLCRDRDKVISKKIPGERYPSKIFPLRKRGQHIPGVCQTVSPWTKAIDPVIV